MNDALPLERIFATLGRRDREPALIELDEEEAHALSCRRLAARAESVARGLPLNDLGSERRIALLAPPGTAWIELFLGLLRAGVTVVPLDTQLEAEYLVTILTDAGIRYVVADAPRRRLLDELDYDGTVLGLLDDDADETWQRWLKDEGELPAMPGPDDVAVLLYTSGTTGPPKGVPLRHRHLGYQVEAVDEAGLVQPDDRMLQPLPLHHVYPLVIGVMLPLALGVPIVLPAALTGPGLVRAIRAQDVTIVLGVPGLYAALLAGVDRRIDALPAPGRALARGMLRASTALRAATGLNAGRWLLRPLHQRIGPRLRMLASGGSPLDPAVARRLGGIGWDVAIGYGLTETAPLLTIKLPGDGSADSVGRVVPGTELRIDRSVESDGNEEAGEILARGPGVFDGYLDRDEETQEAFAAEGWFRTGDLGWLDDDGFLHVLGRKSTMLVTASGENIRTEALEEAYAAHPQIAEIGILKDDDRLVAVIHPAPEALRDDADSLEDTISAAVGECSEKLPSHQRIDGFRITREPLDRTRLDKIRRGKLEERYESLGAEEAESEPEPMAIEDMAPEDRELLANDRARQAWELIGRRFPGARVRPDTSFRLALGLDSLGWLDLSTDIMRATGVELREDDIAGIDTVRDLLEVVAGEEPSPEQLQDPLEDPEARLSEDQKTWLEPRSWASAAATNALYRLNSGLMQVVFRVRREGSPPAGREPLVITPNHASLLDPFALAAALPPDRRRELFWGGLAGWAYRNRVFTVFSRLGRVIPIDPERSMVSELAFAKAVLDRGRSLVWFPEGQRSTDGRLGPLRPGIGVLLENSPNVRVLPVWIEGAFDALPVGRLVPRPHRITVHLGEHRSARQLEAQGEGDNQRQRLLDGLRRELEALHPS
ncbi:AMP-binding protein [Thioalkalivibrio sp. XN8]|uniref:AMP-binding protein n=1 Tax=Thioalkalivibrio sp. XN8 TaxID=2712863 RepID=UPI0013ED51AC|nr:AMP-binding protein [Thioalkalivibrio sp. XN8]NGP54482.1 AMP-binding protein [Thioalkalivibrio sp. XN8]